MRASILIAALNEGESLLRTVAACAQTCADLEYEIVLADNGSSDGSIEAVVDQFPAVRIVANREARGTGSTKHLAATQARGDVLVFLDGHCKAEPGAIAELVRAVEELKGQAAVMPRIAALDGRRWLNLPHAVGGPLKLDLVTLEYEWAKLRAFRAHGRFTESAGLLGCCFAISRELYFTLGGFDTGVQFWGSEDLDLGLTAWLMGYAVMHDPLPVIGHRFRDDANHYPADEAHSQANKLRMARRHFAESTWEDWVGLFHQRHPPQMAEKAWDHFQTGRESVEFQRDQLQSRRVRDEYWFAEHFGLAWPRRTQ